MFFRSALNDLFPPLIICSFFSALKYIVSSLKLFISALSVFYALMYFISSLNRRLAWIPVRGGGVDLLLPLSGATDYHSGNRPTPNTPPQPSQPHVLRGTDFLSALKCFFVLPLLICFLP